jgi:formylmethanofuran dehydrogenase subunit B
MDILRKIYGKKARENVVCGVCGMWCKMLYVDSDMVSILVGIWC